MPSSNDNKVTDITTSRNIAFEGDNPANRTSTKIDNSLFSVKTDQDNSFKEIKDILDNPLKNKLKTILKMVLVIVLPVITLLAVVIYDLMAALKGQSVAMKSMIVIDKLEALNTLVYHIQIERGMTATLIDGGSKERLQTLKEYRINTDVAFSHTTLWPTVLVVDGKDIGNPKSFKLYLDSFRESMDERLNSNETLTYDMSYKFLLTYTEMNEALITFSGSFIEVPAISGLWKTPVTNNFLTQISEFYGQIRALGVMFYSWCRLTPQAYTQISASNGSALNLLQRVFFLKDGLKKKLLELPLNSPNYAKLYLKWQLLESNFMNNEGCFNLTLNDKKNAQDEWFGALTDVINIVLSFRGKLVDEFNQQLNSFSQDMRAKTIIYLSILLFTNIVSICLLIWFSSRLNGLLGKLAGFAAVIRSKSTELAEEKKKASALLHSMLPAEVVEQLMKKQEVQAKYYDRVTIYFSDIVKFTEISGKSSPLQIVTMLNALYSGFDELIEKYEVYKVETIGDAYMVAAGVPKIIHNHAKEMALLSFDLLDFAKDFHIEHIPGQELLLRIGMHSGSVVAGVVGQKMPRYCLFGDTVNTASRMESHGEAKRIHISGSTKLELEACDDFNLIERSMMQIKGKGEMLTYWLERK